MGFALDYPIPAIQLPAARQGSPKTGARLYLSNRISDNYLDFAPMRDRIHQEADIGQR
jgi:hypothetical protein